MKRGFRRECRSTDSAWRSGMGAMLMLLLLCLVSVRVMPDRAMICLAGYGAVSLTVYAGIYFHTARRVNTVLYRLAEMIENLAQNRAKEVFPAAEDTILSRVQEQLFRLYDILRSYEEREHKIRAQLDENIGDLVHQLNTPVTNIRLYAGFLEKNDLTAEEREAFMKCLKEQAEKLSWLGESFSKISRLETGIIRLRPERQRAEQMILHAVSQVMEKAQSRKMEIELTGEPGGEVLADAKWTSEAIFNLLDNAVKYGEEGSSIEICVTLLTGYVRIAVRNSGQRIDKEEYHRIFHRFYRGKETAGKEGTGLGLYITRKILEEERGYVQAGETADGRTELMMYLVRPASDSHGGY